MNIAIDGFINKFIKKIGKLYELDDLDLANIWIEISKTKTCIEEHETRNEKLNTNLNKNEELNCCKYVFSRPPKVGIMCGEIIKESQTYCFKHKKYENKNMKVRDALPKQLCKETRVDTPNYKKNVYLYKHKVLNLLWHPASGAVIDSKDNKKVIGFVKDKYSNHIQNITEENRYAFLNYKFLFN